MNNRPITVSKPLNTLIRLDLREHHNHITPANSDDEDSEPNWTRFSFNEDHNTNDFVPEQTNYDDLYAPLSPEEADLDQLAEFFTSFNDNAFLGDLTGSKQELQVQFKRAHDDTATLVEQGLITKRRRLSESSLSSYDSDDELIELAVQQFKRSRVEI
ncbi:MAG: hypothetical protein ACI8RD_003350 [Bacillariaceae sp.]|jgi:hypothetical protein